MSVAFQFLNDFVCIHNLDFIFSNEFECMNEIPWMHEWYPQSLLEGVVKIRWRKSRRSQMRVLRKWLSALKVDVRRVSFSGSVALDPAIWGAVAIHCKAGLGRTGTLIGLWCMKEAGWGGRAFIGWNRICRPGSILGPQQQYLCEMERQFQPKFFLTPS